MWKTTRRQLAGLMVLASMAAMTPAQANDDYPAKQIRLLVDGPPGGINDIWARRYAQRISDSMKQPVVVENRPGASGTIAAEALARSPADGYTMFYGGMSPLISFPGAGGQIRYDPARDFVPVALGTIGFPILAVSPALGVKTVGELVAKAKARPAGDELACGTGGIASFGHFACALFSRATGAKLRIIPYKGATLAAMDVVGGQIHIVHGFSSEFEPFAKQGQLMGVGLHGSSRLPKWPAAQTMAEAGYTGLELPAFSGFYVPAGTPGPIVSRLNAELVKAMQHPQMTEWLATAGGVWMPMTVQEFSEFYRREREKWKRMSEETGIRVEQ